MKETKPIKVFEFNTRFQIGMIYLSMGDYCTPSGFMPYRAFRKSQIKKKKNSKQ